MGIRGIGPLTALAIVATVGNARDFKNGRQFAAWLGLTPRQHSSGGKSRLGHITKRGDAYLRGLLVQGARAVLHTAARHADRLSRWSVSLQARRGYRRALVAIAAKNARIAWALLSKNQDAAPGLSTSAETATVDDESVEPALGHPELIEGGTRCRLTCEDQACGFHQGQSIHAHKQAVYSDAVRPIRIQQRCS